MVIAPLVMSILVAARAQPAPASTPRSYGFVSAGLSLHPGNGESYHRVDDHLHGTTWTLGGGGGAFLTPAIGLEAEVLFAGTVSAPQAFRYTNSQEYIANNRDVLINGLVRVRAGGTAAVQFVVGGGLAYTRTQHTSVVNIDSFFRRTPGPDDTPETYAGPTVTGGLDAAFAAGAHAAIGPSFRIRWMHRPAGGDVGWNGIGPLAFQIGATVLLR